MHGYTVVAFHLKVFRLSLFIFSQGMARLCKVYLLSFITMTRMSKIKTTNYTGVSDKCRCREIRDIGENDPRWRTSSPVSSWHELLHDTRTPGSTLTEKQLPGGPTGLSPPTVFPNQTMEHRHIRGIPHTQAPCPHMRSLPQHPQVPHPSDG